METPIKWYSSFRLGDCFWHALFLRKLGGSHIFYCRDDYHPDLRDVLSGRDVELRPIQNHASESPNAIDAWIGSDQQAGRSWWAKGRPTDLIPFLIEWFAALAAEIGREPVFRERSDLLADYPAIQSGAMKPIIDLLVLNCDPQSSQAPAYVPAEMDALLQRLGEAADRRGRHNTVASVNPTTAKVPVLKTDLSGIGYHSIYARAIAGVANGPIFPTWNVWNKETPRYMILDEIRLDYGTGCKTVHVPDVAGLERALQADGFL